MNKPLNIESINTPSLHSICQKYGVQELYAFGSIVSMQVNSESDLDFLVVFNRDTPHGAFDHFMGLKLALELEFERPVDLLTLKPFRNPLFQQEIDETKVLLYAA
jgi:uncharacterized protein